MMERTWKNDQAWGTLIKTEKCLLLFPPLSSPPPPSLLLFRHISTPHCGWECGYGGGYMCVNPPLLDSWSTYFSYSFLHVCILLFFVYHCWIKMRELGFHWTYHVALLVKKKQTRNMKGTFSNQPLTRLQKFQKANTTAEVGLELGKLYIIQMWIGIWHVLKVLVRF